MMTLLKTVHNKKRFKDLCSILKAIPYYQKFSESLKIYYAIHQCRNEIPQLLVNVDHLLSSMKVTSTDKEVHAVTISLAESKCMSRETYFTNVLLTTYQNYFQLHFMSCLKKDPDNTRLLHKIDGVVNSLDQVSLSNINVYSPIKEPALNTYHDFLIDHYKRGFNGDWFTADSSLSPENVCFNLALIKSDENEKSIATLRFGPSEIFFEPKPVIDHNEISELDLFSSDCSGQHFLIQGVAGCGKTMMAFRICQLWANGNLPNFHLVILLRLNDPSVAKVKSMKELFGLHIETLGEDIAKEIDCEHTAGKGILIILDGWNELSEHQQRDSLFVEILSTKLPKSTIVVTARLSEAFRLQQQYGFTRVIEILNLKEPQVKECLKYCFPEDEGKNFLQETTKHIHLKALVLAPLFLSLLIHIYKKGNQKLSESIAQVYKTILLLIFNRHLEEPLHSLESLPDDSPVLLLSKLAYNNLLKGKTTTIAHAEMCKFCSQSDQVSLDYHWFGLLHKEYDPKTGQPNTYQFFHHTIQQFLAAHYLSQQFDPKQQEDELKKMFTKSQCQSLCIFYAGLTGFANTDIIRVIPKMAIKGRLLTMTTRGVYNLVATALMKNNGTKDCTRMNFSAQDYGSFVYDNISRESLLTLMASCVEAQNTEACKSICCSNLFLTNFCYAEIPDSAVNGYFLSSLLYCIICSGKKWVVQCNLKNDATEFMLAQFREPGEASGNIVALQTKVSPENTKAVISLLKSPLAKQLQSLDLSHSTNIDEIFVQKPAPFLQSVVVLDLIDCDIQSSTAKYLAELLRLNPALEYLALTENLQLTIEDVTDMINALTNNDTLLVLAIDGPLQKATKVKEVTQKINCIRKEHKAKLLGFDCFETMRLSTVWSKLTSVVISAAATVHNKIT